MRVGADEALRQAPQRAGGGQEPLDVVAGRRERVGGAFVHDDHGTACGERRSGVPQRFHRAGQVVHALEEEHHVVPGCPVGRGVAEVADLHGDPVGDAVGDGVAAGGSDRGVVVVEPVDAQVAERLGQFDGRPAGAAAEVADPCRTAGVGQSGVHVGDLRQPLGGEGVDEGGVGDRRAGAVRVDQGRQYPADGGQGAGEAAEVGRARLVDENVGHAVGEGEPGGRRVGAVGGQQPGDSLVLEPLAQVPLGAAGAGGQFGGRQRAVGQGAVQVQPDPDVHAAQFQRADAGPEQPPGKRPGGAGLDHLDGHGVHPFPVSSGKASARA